MSSDLAPKFAPFIGMVSNLTESLLSGANEGYLAGRHCCCNGIRMYVRRVCLSIASENHTIIFIILTSCYIAIGAAYGTAKSGIGIAGVGTFRPDLIMKCLIPVVMSGIIAVYSLVISVLIAQDLQPPSKASYSLFTFVHHSHSRQMEIRLTLARAFMHLGSGIAVGVTGLAAGYCIGVVGENGVRAYMEQSRIFVGMVLVLIFGEVLGLYGYASFSLLMCQVLTLSNEQADCCFAFECKGR
ncbi:hypothetical protein Golomagni_07772 [Golovinomyces magnicellulatus]|nr:hypothetical protein Golomagni_07772 [Golovinomyces magnicellulatus]